MSSSRHETWFEASLRATGICSPYHMRSHARYCKTLSLVELHVALSTETTVAEVGPGWLLPMLGAGCHCHATAYGLLDDPHLERALQVLDIPHVVWDLHEPLTARNVTQHDAVLFLEVIEHICRWPAVPLAFALLGWVVRSVRAGAARWHPSDTRWLLLPMFVNLCFVLLTANSDNVMFFLVKNGAVPFLVVWLSTAVGFPPLRSIPVARHAPEERELSRRATAGERIP